MKTLITYFSASGVTKKVAEKIAQAVEGDLFEIEPVEKYTEEDLDWTNKESRTTIEMQDKSFRPPIKNKVENLQDYNKVIIGFPVWWYTAPTIINTFLEENNLEGKDVNLFCTSGGSGIEKCKQDLQKVYPTLNFKEGKRFTENVSSEEINNWLR